MDSYRPSIQPWTPLGFTLHRLGRNDWLEVFQNEIILLSANHGESMSLVSTVAERTCSGFGSACQRVLLEGWKEKERGHTHKTTTRKWKSYWKTNLLMCWTLIWQTSTVFLFSGTWPAQNTKLRRSRVHIKFKNFSLPVPFTDQSTIHSLASVYGVLVSPDKGFGSQSWISNIPWYLKLAIWKI